MRLLKRLKLKYDGLLSNFSFNFNVWHYTEAMAEYKLKGGSKKGGIIANPNCSTIIALMVGTSKCYPPRHQRRVIDTHY